VVLTGFGRTDTHELPNSLTWGPDGFLYGLNGVFNHCLVRHRGQEHAFNCALWRIDPVPDADGPWAGTHAFELFAEGTSNPWGIAWNEDGEAFLSACVIDHLWHLTERGYYHRQGGPYPPHTWKLESIVAHRHQMAAYCGITWFDSDAYPAEYRERLYMGNIHGGCVNVDALERRGSSYFATPRPDFLTAHDVWHMPVAQQTGPDGALHVLDWYDRYHCYQDANADPEGVDRGHGRLYRVRYRDSPRAPRFDLAAEPDPALVQRLGSPNVFFRERAQRILAERLRAGLAAPGTAAALEALVQDAATPEKLRRHAFWSLLGGRHLPEPFLLGLLSRDEPWFRAWAVRAAGIQGSVSPAVAARIAALAGEPEPDRDVLRQLAAALPKIEALSGHAPALLADVLAACGDDAVIPPVVWQVLHPRLGTPEAAAAFLDRFEGRPLPPGYVAMAPYFGEHAFSGPLPPRLEVFLRLFGQLQDAHPGPAGDLLAVLARRVRNQEIDPAALAAVRPRLEALTAPWLGDAASPSPALRLAAASLAVTWGHPDAPRVLSGILGDGRASEADRTAAAAALASAVPDAARAALEPALRDRNAPLPVRRATLSALGRLHGPDASAAVLRAYPDLPPPLQRDAVELLARSADRARALLGAIQAGTIPATAVNPLQASQLAAAHPDLRTSVEALWGRVRTERDPKREEVIARTRKLVGEQTGDWKNGKAVFARACAACHRLHGEGNLIGPDLTTTGRGTLDQLLSNLLDPNLVIGEAYQARIAHTADGRAVMGLPVEDNAQRLVLRTPAGQDEVLPRNLLRSVDVLPVSLMPEGLEGTMTPRELVDLVNYLAWDLHPEHPDARALAGVKLP
jgi:putative heme-binding domain-containing protein